MNKKSLDLLRTIVSNSYHGQRELAEITGYSLGTVNKSLKLLVQEGLLSDKYALTQVALKRYSEQIPESAIILAAGYGMRMIPINREIPKGLLQVKGETLIERIIRQLHGVGVFKIYIVVGFMKESYEFLIDKYGVELVVNTRYASTNNLISLKCVAEHIHNTYILPCDIWAAHNPFRDHEFYSWYMVSDTKDSDSNVKINRNLELIRSRLSESGNRMIGISFIHKRDAEKLRSKILEISETKHGEGQFWETALFSCKDMELTGRLVSDKNYLEINTYEQLRSIDSNGDQLRSEALDTISNVFCTILDSITGIEILKKGMTNRSFLFNMNGEKYIMRIPGEGTDQLIDRKHEAEVYQTISGKGLCDDVIYIDSEKGYKITRYLDNTRICNTKSKHDLERCMKLLRKFHEMELSVEHDFDVFEKIDMYEKLRNRNSVYQDYEETKSNVLSLRGFINSLPKNKVLSHIDAVPDNFLFYKTDNGEEQLQLTDWEYAGMQDPHIDIAMFCIYAMYDKEQVDQLIDIYFENQCDCATRAKIYAYIASGGLLWSNWCEFKQTLGVEFGEYSLRQYRFAKEYYRHTMEEVRKLRWSENEKKQI